VHLGNQLLQAGHFHHVSKGVPFANSPHFFYVFEGGDQPKKEKEKDKKGWCVGTCESLVEKL